MIYITQLIYIQQGKEQVFHEFEDVAIPIISKYNGRLLLRIRPGTESIIYSKDEAPYEVHLICFDTEGDFGRFKLDEERKKFLHLKEESIRSSLLIQGHAL
ncbi:MAG: hypothetical protein JWQ38_1141 [Flavipsychrobacter sp.]|nr:hypothetical protein [Flavipsychrobacter sp.]